MNSASPSAPRGRHLAESPSSTVPSKTKETQSVVASVEIGTVHKAGTATSAPPSGFMDTVCASRPSDENANGASKASGHDGPRSGSRDGGQKSHSAGKDPAMHSHNPMRIYYNEELRDHSYHGAVAEAWLGEEPSAAQG